MQFPKVSVITVTYNAANDLRRTLENLSAVDYPALEVVVVDGASQDNTSEIMKQFADLITVGISEPDNGIYDAMNKGLAAASGEYVWFVNAGDTVFDVQFLRNIFSGEGETADIYYGETLVVSPSGEVLGLRKKVLPERLTWMSFFRGMVVCHQSILVRRSIAPVYDLRYRYVADIEWVLVCLKRARRIVNTHCVVSVFETGGTSTRHRREGLKERLGIMRRHFGILLTVLAHGLFVFDALKPAYRKQKP